MKADKRWLVTAAALTMLEACGGKPPDTSTLVIDKWWNDDYPKSVCIGRVADEDMKACEDAVVKSQGAFINAIASGVAASERCKPVKVQASAPGLPEPDLSAQHWTLAVNFREAADQPWKLTDPSAHVTQGQGKPNAIVSSVCASMRP